MKIDNKTWNSWSSAISHPAEPTDYAPAAVERLMEQIDPFVVDVKGVRSQFNPINTTQLIDFQSAAEKKFYMDAWERYEEIKRRIEGYDLSGSQSRFLILAQFTVFRRAAELCRAPWLAKAMWESVTKHNQAACLAVNFKGTIRKAVDVLVNDYNVPRDQIALIWGGGKTVKSKKQKAKEVLTTNDELKAILREAGLAIEDLGGNLSDVADYVDDGLSDETLRLGTQSLKERQCEIDRFQRGSALYGMFTFKAGGVGLSLHHTDELTEFKARRKKNGWVVEEDIPKVFTRQRICFLAPTFSAIELVQGLGRCPRLTSLSNTPQTIVFYRGTIEERVAAIVSMKLRCLRKVVRSKESWEDTIIGGIPENERHYTPAELKDDDEADDGFFGSDEEDEE